jgi:preprotein translocase subunit SecF
VFAWLGHVYDVEVGTSFIAAILTILGYSITDTIVVLDRVRENLPKHSGSFAEIVEASVHQTFLRSLNTSFATLLTLAAVHFFGGSTLHEFTLTLMIGIAVGTYSSIFVASPLLVSWHLWTLKRRA